MQLKMAIFKKWEGGGKRDVVAGAVQISFIMAKKQPLEEMGVLGCVWLCCN